MPKIKTNRSAAKRFKKTGTGKIVYHKAFGSHILSTKSRKRKRVLRKSPILNPSNRRAVKLLLPNG
jgi:large subunit ribosomal protein L35